MFFLLRFFAIYTIRHVHRCGRVCVLSIALPSFEQPQSPPR